ncbi:hypothetical protein KP509_25G029700 [Ceratopteris richardii]|nr:hypothetical protein KP509_25G029700 [Ceratopteris richardii]
MNNIPVEGVFCGRIPSEVFAPSIMVDNREGRSNCFQLCRAHGFEESINQGLAKVDSNSDSEHLQYVHSSVIHNATTPIFDNTEESAMRASKTDSDVATKDFPGTNVNNLDNPYYKNTFIGNEVVGSEDYSSQKIHDFRGALNDEILEDDEDEGYVLKDEDKIDGSSDNDSYHDFHGKSGPEQFGNDMSEFAKCSLGRDVFTEDESWSEEPYVSSQARYFPPPISILANENQPGLPSHVPKTLWRSVKRDGRFILQEVQARPREFFQAIRECGRLKLQLVRLESDSSGSSFDSASPEDGEDFFFSNESVDSTNALPQIDQQVESYDAVASMTAEQNSQSVVGRLALKICNHVTENDVSARHNPIGKDSEMHLQPLAPSALLTDKADDILQAACSDAKFEHGVGSEMNQRTSAASIVLRESASQVGSDVGETPFSTEHNVTVEKRLGEPVIDEGFGRNSNYVMVA